MPSLRPHNPIPPYFPPFPPISPHFPPFTPILPYKKFRGNRGQGVFSRCGRCLRVWVGEVRCGHDSGGSFPTCYLWDAQEGATPTGDGQPDKRRQELLR